MRLAQLMVAIGTGENDAGQHGVQKGHGLEHAKTLIHRLSSRTDAPARSWQKVNGGRCAAQQWPDETWPPFGERLITLRKSILSTPLDLVIAKRMFTRMDFSTLIAPFDADEFHARYLNREPVVIRGEAGNARANLLNWDRLNAMLQIRPHWAPERIKMVLNSRPIDPDFYLEERGGRLLASPVKVEAMLGVGATLVGDMIEEIDPDLARLTAMIANRYGAQTGINVYASFKGVQAFASHCDLHEVFAIQCEGAKRWRIYRNRADNPTEALTGEDAQTQIDAAKGPVMMDVTLEVGDMIYIPRGFFHDAIATDAASLHLTIGFAPPSGMLVFNFLQDLAKSDSLFREYLPDARLDDGAILQRALVQLGARLNDIAHSTGMHERIGQWQRKLHRPTHEVSLPRRPVPSQFSRTGKPAQLIDSADGTLIVTATGESERVGLLSDVAAYIIVRSAVVREEVRARFYHHPIDEVDNLIDRMVAAGILIRNN